MILCASFVALCIGSGVLYVRLCGCAASGALWGLWRIVWRYECHPELRRFAWCYECHPADCRKGLYAEKIKPRAFAEFARRYGTEELLDCLERNEQAGVVYHREGIMGDYDDFEELEELIAFIRTGKR